MPVFIFRQTWSCFLVATQPSYSLLSCVSLPLMAMMTSHAVKPKILPCHSFTAQADSLSFPICRLPLICQPPQFGMLWKYEHRHWTGMQSSIYHHNNRCVLCVSMIWSLSVRYCPTVAWWCALSCFLRHLLSSNNRTRHNAVSHSSKSSHNWCYRCFGRKEWSLLWSPTLPHTTAIG